MTQIDQLRKLKTLRERGIRNEIAEIAAAEAALRVKREEVVTSRAQLHDEWRTAIAESGEFDSRGFGRHVEKLTGFCRNQAAIVQEIEKLRQEAEWLVARREDVSAALRDNLRGQEKFGYLAEQITNR